MICVAPQFRRCKPTETINDHESSFLTLLALLSIVRNCLHQRRFHTIPIAACVMFNARLSDVPLSPIARILRHAPAAQPINYSTFKRTQARLDDFRLAGSRHARFDQRFLTWPPRQIRCVGRYDCGRLAERRMSCARYEKPTTEVCSWRRANGRRENPRGVSAVGSGFELRYVRRGVYARESEFIGTIDCRVFYLGISLLAVRQKPLPCLRGLSAAE